MMKASFLHIVLQTLLFDTALSAVKYVKLTDTCTAHESTSGKAVFCCNGACQDGTHIGKPGQCQGWRRLCEDVGGISCGANQGLVSASPLGVDVGPEFCWASCHWRRNHWTWSCCDCPSGYTAVDKGSCSKSGRAPLPCVGCSDPQEVLTGDATTGFHCSIPTATTATNSPPAPTGFDWAPLVQKACNNYAQAKAVAPRTLGYFGQIVNIVCAAAKSADPCCADMSPYYNKPGCEGQWAGPFDQYVFDSFLGPNAPPFNSVLESILNGVAPVAWGLEPWWTMPIFKTKDWGSLLAGAEHFLDNLGPAFSAYIQNLLSKYVAACDRAGLSKALESLQVEHAALFNCAVVPGFAVEGRRGEISPIAVRIAQLSVPVTAASLRYAFITKALVEPRLLFCLRRLRVRDTNGDGASPSIDTVKRIAAFLNLTTPETSPLVYDPRAWIPKEQPPVSVLSLPSAYFQILPNSKKVMIEATLSDSTASVEISTDRSAFNSEAVIAVSLSPVDLNSSSLVTAYPFPNTSIYLFGLITMIIPSTAPVGGNQYLFLGNTTNTTLAQYLNQSSVIDDGYNVLFNSFDLSMKYDGLPSGVDAADLLLIDVVEGSIVKSTTDVLESSVNAVGLEGHNNAWGGGGIYAIGYAATNANKSHPGPTVTGTNPPIPFLSTGASPSVNMAAILFGTAFVIVFSVASSL